MSAVRVLPNPLASTDVDASLVGREPLEFHRRLPEYAPTPLVDAPKLADSLGVGRVWVKDESHRLGLPAFKILGASWAVYRALDEHSRRHLGSGLEPWEDVEDLRARIEPLNPLTLAAATDGNHGRAVARMAKLLGLSSRIFVPSDMVPARIEAIESEGAEVIVLDGTYDEAVARSAEEANERCLVISDTSWPGYEDIPAWVIEGYSTILWEIDDELERRGEEGPTLVIAQIGVGAFAAAVTAHYRKRGVSPRPKMLGVEPARAACMLSSVEAGHIVHLPGPHASIMAGLNCGAPSMIAWPIVSRGVDVFVSVEDEWAREAMRTLARSEIVSGETGGAGLAGLLALMESEEGEQARRLLGIDEKTRVLLFNCEGATDPEAYARIVRDERDVTSGLRSRARSPTTRGRDVREGTLRTEHRGRTMREAYELSTFLGRTVPVEFAAELSGFEVEGKSVFLQCSTGRYEPEMYGYYGTRCETLFRPPTPGEPATLRLDFETDEILRLRYSPGPGVPENETPMVVGSFDGPSRLDVSEDEGAVTFETAALRVVVDREPLRLVAYDRAGRAVWATRPVDIEPMRRSERQWHPEQERWLFLHRYAYPLGVAPDGAYGSPQAFASFDLCHDEHVYGFGEGYGPLDKRGTRQKLWLQEAFSNAVPAAYKQAPFYLSSRGYGMFVNTSNALNFRVGELDHTALSVTVEDSGFLDLYLVYGPSPKEILPRYAEITGRPAVPPKWTFGLWMGRITYERQEEVEGVAKELREHRIPCDVIHVDTGWFEQESVCDLKFGKENFPDPAAMMEKLRAEGFRVSLWQWPNMVLDSEMFDEGREGGFLAKRENGAAYLVAGYGEDAGFIDYSNPEAVEWVKGKFRELFGMGVAAIKTDFGEGAPPDAFYHGVPGEAIHNLYPLLYNRAVFEVTEEFAGEGRGVVWSRSAWAGSQRYPVHWSGDGIARFEDLACVLRSALAFGMSGFPFYSHDIGGFVGVPSPELYARWAQLGFFSSHARCHGAPPREPWAYGEEAERIFRLYDELRYRLLPYVYTEAVECGRSCLPMLRPLFLDFGDDPTTYPIEDQYLFGRNILVAPVLDEGDRRLLYLPHGVRWVDYWTKEVLEGGCWIEREAPLDVLPLYVRAGAVVPCGPVMQYVDEVLCDPLTVEVYAPGGEGSYAVHDENGPDVPISYRREGDALIVEVGAAPGRVELVVFGAGVSGAGMDGEALEVRPAEGGGASVGFDCTERRTVTLRLARGSHRTRDGL